MLGKKRGMRFFAFFRGVRPVGSVIFQGRGARDAWKTRGGFVFFRVGVLLVVAIRLDARCAVLVLRFPSPVAAQKNVD